jgi:hypothetical protein
MLVNGLYVNILSLLYVLTINDEPLLCLLLLNNLHVYILVRLIWQMIIREVMLERLQRVAIGAVAIYQELLVAHPTKKEQCIT